MKTEDQELTPDSYGLTLRELKILELVAEGRTRKEIAENLNISIHTVDTHLTSVYRKLGVKSDAEAVTKWLSRWLPPGFPNLFC